MSTEHSTADHGHGAKGHHPHILPLKVYMGVGSALFILTGVTVGTALFLNLGSVGNFVLAMIIATVKASLVALFFMHLLYDNKIYLTIFIGALVFLSIFILFTMADTERRGDIYPAQAIPIEHPTIYGLQPENNPISHASHGEEGAAHGGDESHGTDAGHDAADSDDHGETPAKADGH